MIALLGNGPLGPLLFASLVVALFYRRQLLDVWRDVTSEPSVDIEGQVEDGYVASVRRGMGE